MVAVVFATHLRRPKWVKYPLEREPIVLICSMFQCTWQIAYPSSPLLIVLRIIINSQG